MLKLKHLLKELGPKQRNRIDTMVNVNLIKKIQQTVKAIHKDVDDMDYGHTKKEINEYIKWLVDSSI